MKMKKKKARAPRPQSPLRIICGSFVAVIFIGTLLLLLPCSTRAGISLADALFTATSATCVTGLVAADTYSTFTTFGQAVILGMIQIGGLGLVTLTSIFALALGRRASLHSLHLASENVSDDNLVQTRQLIRFIIIFVLLVEAFGALLLCPVFVPEFGNDGIWISVFLSVSAFCNAGFDILGRLMPGVSLCLYSHNAYVQFVLGLMITSGGLGFVVWQDLLHFHKTHHISLQTRIVLLFSIFLSVFGGIAFAILEWQNPATLASLDFGEKLSNSLFQSISCRTAGFNTVDLATCFPLTKIIMCFLMFIGAAPGGTGGGVKVTTFAVLFTTVVTACTGGEDATIFNRRIGKKVIYRALAILSISMLLVSFCMVFFLYCTPASVNYLDSLFEAISAYCTVGLTVGVTAVMSLPARFITIITMFVGRVGPVTLALSLAGRPEKTYCREILPEGKISVG